MNKTGEMSDQAACLIGLIMALGIIVVIFMGAISAGPTESVRTCSVCGSTNISTTYEDERGFLTVQEMFFCYNCRKEYNAELLRIERRPRQTEGRSYVGSKK
jgi:hypothetical protein